jgi:PPOX class probable F420-dependent enzyme
MPDRRRALKRAWPPVGWAVHDTEEMTDFMLTESMRAFLEEPRFAVLATHMPDGRIQQTVMWYELRGDTIMMNTTRDRVKARNLRHDPRVSICVEDGYNYLTLEGRVSEVIDDPEIAVGDIYALARRYHGDFGNIEERFPAFRTQPRQTWIIEIEHAHDH